MKCRKKRSIDIKKKNTPKESIFIGLNVFQIQAKIEEIKHKVKESFSLENLKLVKKDFALDYISISDDIIKKKEEEIVEKSHVKKGGNSMKSTITTILSKEEILEFFLANQERGLTREEMATFLNCSIKTAIRRLAQFGIDYKDYLIDLRKSKKPESGPMHYRKEEIPEERVDIQDNTVILETLASELNTEDVEKEGTECKPAQNDVRFAHPLHEVWKEDIHVSKPQNMILGIDIISNLEKLTQNENEKDVWLSIMNDIMSICIGNKTFPKFYFFKSDLILLNRLKDNNVWVARYLLRFLAQDTGRYTCFINADRPELKDFSKYCIDNDMILITGNASAILEFKLANANVYIPKVFYKAFPNPLKGEGIVGIDTSALLITTEDFLSYVGNTASILISQIQLQECNKDCDSLPLKIVAYYGEIKSANIYSDISDLNIVTFYKENQVKKVITRDAGFKVFCRFLGVSCDLIKAKNQKATSNEELFDIIDKRFHKIIVRQLGIDDAVNIKEIAESSDKSKIRIFSKNNRYDNISIYTKNYRKRISQMRVTEAYNQDFVIIRKENNQVIVTQVFNSEQYLARVMFVGIESELPKLYRGMI